MKKLVIGFIDGLPVEKFTEENSIISVMSYFEPSAISKIINNFIEKGVKEKPLLAFSRRDEKHIVVIKAEYNGCMFYGIGITNNHRESIEKAKKMLFSKTNGNVSFIAVPILVEELAH